MKKTRDLLLWRAAANLLLMLFCLSSRKAALAKNSVCPTIGAVDTSKNVSTSAFRGHPFNEISGVSISPTQTAPSGGPVFYAINDRGCGALLGVYDGGNGKRIRTLQLANITNIDWEALAIGQCSPSPSEGTCIYIGDIGDNKARNHGKITGRSTTYRILKLREPVWSDHRDNDEITTMGILEFDFRDPSSPSPFADSEAIFLENADLYVVTKWEKGMSKKMNRLFKIPALAWQSTNSTGAVYYSPKALRGTGGDFMGRQWTRAALSPDGSVLALGTTSRTYYFLRCPGQTVEQAVAADACLVQKNPYQGQMESFAWTEDGARTLQIAEGSHQPMGWTDMVYDVATTSQRC